MRRQTERNSRIATSPDFSTFSRIIVTLRSASVVTPLELVLGLTTLVIVEMETLYFLALDLLRTDAEA